MTRQCYATPDEVRYLVELVRLAVDEQNMSHGWPEEARKAALEARRARVGQGGQEKQTENGQVVTTTGRNRIENRPDTSPATLFDQPPYQAHSATSRQAAEAIKEHVPSLEERVYWFIVAHGPCTDLEIQAGLELSGDTERPRRVNLVAKGKVRAAPETRKTPSGNQAVAWVSCEPF